MSESDDEDLKLALAMSLAEHEPQAAQKKETPSVIDLLSDSDDDLDAPVTTRIPSKKPSESDGNGRFTDEIPSATNNNKDNDKTDLTSNNGPSSTLTAGTMAVEQQSAPSCVLGGLDRKKMEDERLARVAARKAKLEQIENALKRKASASPQAQPDNKRHAIDRLADFPMSLSDRQAPIFEPKKKQLGIPSTSHMPSTRGASNTVYGSMALSVSSYKEQQRTVAAAGIQYPDGVVKKTWVHGCPRLGDDIKIEEVLQKEDLDFAVLSAFQVDPDWLISKLDPKTKVVMILQAKTDEEKQLMSSGSDQNFRFCFPSMEGQINCMHSKLQLLVHPTHLRVVLPSANLVPYDWGETGVMENVCFLIDLPRIPAGGMTEIEKLTPFGTELLYFLEAQGLDKVLINSIRKFDFSRTEHLALIHTIGGSHTAESWRRTGYCGLGTAVKRLGLGTKEAVNIDFVTASMGSITEQFMKCMVLAVKGDDGTTELSWRTEKRSSKHTVKASTAAEEKLSHDIQKDCQIYFPTRETVEHSKGGIGCGGTICTSSKWFNSPTFPRSLLRECKSTREGILMHSKIIYVRPKTSSSDMPLKAWAYVGSANLSESAWGRLVKDRAKQTKLNCRNWECGVLFPVPASARSRILAGEFLNRPAAAQELEGSAVEIGMDIFHNHVPVPMSLPGQEYGDRIPWCYMDKE